MSTSKLLVAGLKTGYGKAQVINGLDFHVDAGEIVAIFGPNGAGKTTTMQAIAGLLKLNAGSVLWDGVQQRGSAHKLARSGVAFVGERSVFYQLSAEANLRLGRGPVEDALEHFPELVPLLKRRAGLLSGGEQQMLTMARALAARPSVLLLDEVSAGLAPLIVNRLYAAARKAAEGGMAILLVEQQVRRALKIADRGYVLNRGNFTFSGSAEELTAHLSDGESYFTSGVPGSDGPQPSD